MTVSIGGATISGGVNVGDYVPIVTSGLIARLDASNASSYSGSGTTINDLSGQGATGTINGTVSFVSSGQASYWNFAVGSDSNYISSTLSQAYVDCTVVLYPDFTYAPGAGLAGLIGNNTPASASDKSLRIATGNPWTLRAGPAGLDGNDWAYPSTIYYVNGVSSSTATPALQSGWNIIGGYRPNQVSFPLSFAYYLGSSAYPGRSFQGRLALALLYNRQLTDAEQVQNFTALRGRFSI
jgi:hypothetical protein